MGKSDQALETERTAFINDFMARAAFQNIYTGLTDAAHASQFIAKLEQTARRHLTCDYHY